MSVGPGKYDDLATYVREQAKAEGVIVIVFDGDKGNGFSAQGSIEVMQAVPRVLRGVADDMERDLS